jgi:hypothetical protein
MYNNTSGIAQACCCESDQPYLVQGVSGCNYYCLDKAQVENGTYHQDFFCNGVSGSSAPCQYPICSPTNCKDNQCHKEPPECVPKCKPSQTCGSDGICKDTQCWGGFYGPAVDWSDMYYYSWQNPNPLCCYRSATPFLMRNDGGYGPFCKFLCVPNDEAQRYTPEYMSKYPSVFCGLTGSISPCVNPYC